MFPFNRKNIIKAIHNLLQLHYGTYTELTKLSILELRDIQIVLQDMSDEEKLMNAGMDT